LVLKGEFMTKKGLILVLLLLLVIFLAACGSPETPTQAPEIQEESPPQEVEEDPPIVEEIDAAAIFSSNCARCHGADRSGRNGPALLPDRLTKDASTYQATITNGSGPMPAFGSRLSADEISALVEFILSSPE
jgi:cytochrome c551